MAGSAAGVARVSGLEGWVGRNNFLKMWTLRKCFHNDGPFGKPQANKPQAWVKKNHQCSNTSTCPNKKYRQVLILGTIRNAMSVLLFLFFGYKGPQRHPTHHPGLWTVWRPTGPRRHCGLEVSRSMTLCSGSSNMKTAETVVWYHDDFAGTEDN